MTSNNSSEKDRIKVEKEEREEDTRRVLEENALEFMLSLPEARKIPKVTELETIHATGEQQEEMEKRLLKKNNNE